MLHPTICTLDPKIYTWYVCCVLTLTCFFRAALGETIIQEGESDRSQFKFYIVESGEARAYVMVDGEEVLMSHLGPGELSVSVIIVGCLPGVQENTTPMPHKCFRHPDRGDTYRTHSLPTGKKLYQCFYNVYLMTPPETVRCNLAEYTSKTQIDTKLPVKQSYKIPNPLLRGSFQLDDKRGVVFSFLVVRPCVGHAS